MGQKLFLVVALGLALFSRFAQPAHAASLDATTLKAALHTATPEEDGFIEKVLAKVEDGTLPVAMVESTFLWARQKPKNKFQYFKRGLIERAARIGIDLEATIAPPPPPTTRWNGMAVWLFGGRGGAFNLSFLSRQQSSRR